MYFQISSIYERNPKQTLFLPIVNLAFKQKAAQQIISEVSFKLALDFFQKKKLKETKRLLPTYTYNFSEIPDNFLKCK